MCSPSPPPAPDLIGAANAQGAANADAARLTARANNPNVVNPYGKQTVTWGGGGGPVFNEAGYQSALDAWNQQANAAPEVVGYDRNDLPIYSQTSNRGPMPDINSFYTTTGTGDQPTITQEFSPEYQKIFDTNTQLSQRMGLLGLGAADVAQNTLSNGLDFSGAQGLRDPYSPSSQLTPTTTPQAFDPNSVTLPGTAEQTRKSVIDAMMGRANEDYAKTTDQSNSDLIAAGIRPGTKAYGDRMQMIERSRNDARQQAEIAGGNAAAQQFGMDLSRANQQAGLQGQQFNQLLQGGAQNFGQQQAALQAEQSGQQQGYGQAMDARRQAITEMLAQRQTPINEISAFRTGSQINPLTFSGVSPTQYAPPPLYGAAQGQYNAAGDLYNQQAQQSQGLQSGLFSLGAAALPLLFSDRRLKSNIVRIGTHPLGIGWYEYDIFGHRERGVMADEVAKALPAAVVEHQSGYLMVNYGLL